MAVIVTTEDGQYAGRFDYDKARHWTDRDYNGNGSRGTGRGEGLFRTAGGRWVQEYWSSWEGEATTYHFAEPGQAKEWLLLHREEQAAEEYFGEQPEEEDVRPGRPAIGGKVTIALGEDLLPEIDAYAAQHGLSRAGAVRELVAVTLPPRHQPGTTSPGPLDGRLLAITAAMPEERREEARAHLSYIREAWRGGNHDDDDAAETLEIIRDNAGALLALLSPGR